MTSQEVLNALRLWSCDRHASNTSQFMLQMLKQASRTFMVFFTEYSKLVIKKRSTSCPDEVKISYLESGLSVGLQTGIIAKNTDDKLFEKHCNQFKEPSDHLETFHLESTDIWRSNQAWRPDRTMKADLTVSQLPVSLADEMDWQHSVPMSTIRIWSGMCGIHGAWDWKEKLSFIQEKNVCLWCGRKCHYLKECSFHPAYCKNSINNAYSCDRTETAPSLFLSDFEKSWKMWEKSNTCTNSWAKVITGAKQNKAELEAI